MDSNTPSQPSFVEQSQQAPDNDFSLPGCSSTNCGKQNCGFEFDESSVPQIVVHRCSGSSLTGSDTSNHGAEEEDGNELSQIASGLDYSAGESENGECPKRRRDGAEVTLGPVDLIIEFEKETLSRQKLIDKLIADPSAAFRPFPAAKLPKGQSTKASNFGLFNWHLAKEQTSDHQQKGFFTQKPTMFQHLAKFHNQFGVRHIVMIGLLVVYSLLGGLMFEAIERENEIHNVNETRRNLERSISKMLIDISALLTSCLKEKDARELLEEFERTHKDLICLEPTAKQMGRLKLLIKEYYLAMLKIEGRYIGSVFHKYETLALKNVLNWYFGSAVFYATTLFTTIGYGTVACQTRLGKIASILYAMVGIPLMLVVLSDMGQLMLRFFMFSYDRARNNCKKWVHHFALRILDLEDPSFGKEEEKPSWHRESAESADCELSEESSTTADEDNYGPKEFPLFLSVPIVLLYLLLVSFVISFFDWDHNGAEGIDFGDAFYFSFISLSTIGLGDVMPNNLQYSPCLAILFLVGLVLLSVVNSTVYMRIQSRFLALVNHLDDYLDRIQYNSGIEGHFVMNALAPNIQLLVLALPIFADDQENRIEAMLTTEQHQSGDPFHIHSPRRLRSHSVTGATFQPTLGILNTAPPSRRGTIIANDDWKGYTCYSDDEKKNHEVRPKRSRAATICLASGSAEEGQIKSLKVHWEEETQKKEAKPRRVFTRKTHKISPMPMESNSGSGGSGRALRRVQSERDNNCPPRGLTAIDESVHDQKREIRSEPRRQIFASPRRMRRQHRTAGDDGGRTISGQF